MIILSGVLVVLAIALLVTGIVTGNTGHEVAGLDGLKLIYVSIGVSIISALCLAIGVFLRRKELFGSAETETAAKKSAPRSRTARTAKTKARVGADDDAPVTVAPTTAVDVPAETPVFVVPGRKRYHLETCRQLAGRDKEELTYVEAREEGFTACTACLPDTALAARAAVTEPQPEPAADKPASAEDARTTESLDPVPQTVESPRPASDDPASVTRMDLPVTRLDDEELAPAAESPAAAEVTETPETPGAPAPSAETEPREEPAEEPSESAAERSQARNRSFFEPLDRAEPEPAEDDLSPSAPAEEPAEEPSEPEAAAEPEDDEPSEPAAEAEAEPDEAEEEPAPEKAETDAEAVAEPSEPSEPSEEPVDEPEEAEDTAAADETPEPAEDEAETEPETGGAAADAPLVRILSGTKRYHRPDCALIEDIADDADDLESLSRTEAKERGCTPCLVCQPDKDSADD